ncbi:hypothetical protein JHL18_00550 [Clostridium sp. YIM B02505]|uniref:Phage protein n=1 Tax=Clostridium yunnanense TaxID=2800325 RepID=A0ABS1EIE6_9CLOT|nr:hypothetical protein [Clostridium yunnanense]MBK1809138.1 hypothetical protein [Clostridium yunnanense]
MKLKIGDKTYEQLKFKGRVMRNLLVIQQDFELKQQDNEFGAEDLDVMCEFIANAFGGQFTSDDVLDELEYAEIIEAFRNISSELSKKANAQMKKFEKK